MPNFSDLLPGLLEGFTGQVVEQQKQKASFREKLLELGRRKQELSPIEQILMAEEVSAARARGTQSVQEQRERQKTITGIESRLRELNLSKQGLLGLFKEAETKVPPISGIAQTPGLLPIMGLLRKAGLATGTSEVTKGFIATYPIEARKQLRSLEKGGRFTDVDIEQIIQGSTPLFDESRVARTTKQLELIRKVDSETQTTQQELAELQGRMSGVPTRSGQPSGNRIGRFLVKEE